MLEHWPRPYVDEESEMDGQMVSQEGWNGVEEMSLLVLRVSTILLNIAGSRPEQW